MKTLKQILTYLIWTVVALLIGIIYMYLVLGLGFKTENSTGFFWRLLDIFHEIIAVHVGLRIGGVIALLFILLDVFYLKKKLNNDFKSTVIRFMVMLMITLLVVIIVYIF